MNRTCPFCGRGDLLSVTYDIDAMLAAVACGMCGTNGPTVEIRPGLLPETMPKAAIAAGMAWDNRRCDSLIGARHA